MTKSRTIHHAGKKVTLTKGDRGYLLSIGDAAWYGYGLDDTACCRSLDSDEELASLVKHMPEIISSYPKYQIYVHKRLVYETNSQYDVVDWAEANLEVGTTFSVYTDGQLSGTHTIREYGSEPYPTKA